MLSSSSVYGIRFAKSTPHHKNCMGEACFVSFGAEPKQMAYNERAFLACGEGEKMGPAREWDSGHEGDIKKLI